MKMNRSSLRLILSVHSNTNLALFFLVFAFVLVFFGINRGPGNIRVNEVIWIKEPPKLDLESGPQKSLN